MKLSIFSYAHLPNVCHTHHKSQQQLARSVLVRGSPDCSAHVRFYPCHYVTYLMLLISEAYWTSIEQALSGERGWLTCKTCPFLHGLRASSAVNALCWPFTWFTDVFTVCDHSPSLVQPHVPSSGFFVIKPSPLFLLSYWQSSQTVSHRLWIYLFFRLSLTVKMYS